MRSTQRRPGMEWNGERVWSSSRGGADPLVVLRALVVHDADAAGEEHGGAVGVESLRAAVGAGEGEAVVVGAIERFAVQMCVEAGARRMSREMEVLGEGEVIQPDLGWAF